ncbi:methanogenesis marker protein Mmp4/MtxX [Methanopyrus sp.]
MKVGIALSGDVPGAVERVLEAVERVDVDVVVYHDVDIDAEVEGVRVEDPGLALVEDLVEGRLDAAVRGAVPGRCVRELIGALDLPFTGRSTVLEVEDRRVLLTPVGIDEGWEVASLVELGELAARFYRRLASEEPSVAVVSSGRLEDFGRRSEIDRWLADGELIARLLRERGVKAEHVGILVEEALERDVVLFVNGVLGNLAFRCLSLVAGLRSHGAPVLAALRRGVVFVDTSRAQRASGYARALRLAAELAGG